MSFGDEMTFDELICDYGFVTSDGNLFWKQQSETTFLVIEKKIDNEGNQRYDFYKLNNKHQEIKFYERNVIEFFLVRRVVSHFNFLKELDRKKKLEPFGGSEIKYLQHLKKKHEDTQKMKEANLAFHDGIDRRKRRKYSDNQLRMDFEEVE